MHFNVKAVVGLHNETMCWLVGSFDPLKSTSFPALWSWRGTSWVPVAGCEHVHHPLICNLTEAFSNPKEIYLTQVTALLQAQASQPFILPRFQPIKDSKWHCIETRTCWLKGTNNGDGFLRCLKLRASSLPNSPDTPCFLSFGYSGSFFVLCFFSVCFFGMLFWVYECVWRNVQSYSAWHL